MTSIRLHPRRGAADRRRTDPGPQPASRSASRCSRRHAGFDPAGGRLRAGVLRRRREGAQPRRGAGAVTACKSQTLRPAPAWKSAPSATPETRPPVRPAAPRPVDATSRRPGRRDFRRRGPVSRVRRRFEWIALCPRRTPARRGGRRGAEKSGRPLIGVAGQTLAKAALRPPPRPASASTRLGPSRFRAAERSIHDNGPIEGSPPPRRAEAATSRFPPGSSELVAEPEAHGAEILAHVVADIIGRAGRRRERVVQVAEVDVEIFGAGQNVVGEGVFDPAPDRVAGMRGARTAAVEIRDRAGGRGVGDRPGLRTVIAGIGEAAGAIDEEAVERIAETGPEGAVVVGVAAGVERVSSGRRQTGAGRRARVCELCERILPR